MPVLGTIKGTTTDAKLWIPVHEVESSALDQVRNVVKLPWVVSACFMPDIHMGRGCCIGAVIGMRKAVSPNLVGVDIGCGVSACKTNLKASDLPDNLKLIRAQIERDIPVGFNKHGGLPKEVSKNAVEHLKTYNTLNAHIDGLLKDKYGNIQYQIGSLGSGNHYVEVCLDTEDSVWITLHSGSRNIGKELADIHINIAKKLIHNNHLPDPDLAVFLAGTPEMNSYRHDLQWAQEYARYNRETMMTLCQNALRRFFPQVQFEKEISCHHNYVSEEVHFGEELFVTRKGAISAKKGELGIIPGSMNTGSYIVRGLGNEESLSSASHGAGRRMSRSKAKKTFTMEDVEKQLQGVECRRDQGIIDELPLAYKSIEQVMANQNDLVEIVAKLKQVLCVKG
jgi:tRNA-splicing ligase RtcB (3'-phosphate/5'-hydroxy nucleic acid ligase)